MCGTPRQQGGVANGRGPRSSNTWERCFRGRRRVVVCRRNAPTHLAAARAPESIAGTKGVSAPKGVVKSVVDRLVRQHLCARLGTVSAGQRFHCKPYIQAHAHIHLCKRHRRPIQVYGVRTCLRACVRVHEPRPGAAMQYLAVRAVMQRGVVVASPSIISRY